MTTLAGLRLPREGLAQNTRPEEIYNFALTTGLASVEANPQVINGAVTSWTTSPWTKVLGKSSHPGSPLTLFNALPVTIKMLPRFS